MNEKLHQLLAPLRLKGIAGALDQELKRAEKEAAPVSQVLHRLLIERAIGIHPRPILRQGDHQLRIRRRLLSRRHVHRPPAQAGRHDCEMIHPDRMLLARRLVGRRDDVQIQVHAFGNKLMKHLRRGPDARWAG